MEKLGKKIRALRESLNLSQGQFADLIGCGQRIVSIWENGNSSPTGAHKRKLDELFNQMAALDSYKNAAQAESLSIKDFLSMVGFISTKRHAHELLGTLTTAALSAARIGKRGMSEEEVNARLADAQLIISTEIYPAIRENLIQHGNGLSDSVKAAIGRIFGSFDAIGIVGGSFDLKSKTFSDEKPVGVKV